MEQERLGEGTQERKERKVEANNDLQGAEAEADRRTGSKRHVDAEVEKNVADLEDLVSGQPRNVGEGLSG